MVDSRSDDPADDAISVTVDEDTYVVYNDMEREDVTVTIALALSEIADVPPTDVIPEFPQYVDPDALDRLFRPRPDGQYREGGPLHLTIRGYEVTVFSTGRIEIDPP